MLLEFAIWVLCQPRIWSGRSARGIVVWLVDFGDVDRGWPPWARKEVRLVTPFTPLGDVFNFKVCLLKLVIFPAIFLEEFRVIFTEATNHKP